MIQVQLQYPLYLGARLATFTAATLIESSSTKLSISFVKSSAVRAADVPGNKSCPQRIKIHCNMI